MSLSQNILDHIIFNVDSRSKWAERSGRTANSHGDQTSIHGSRRNSHSDILLCPISVRKTTRDNLESNSIHLDMTSVDKVNPGVLHEFDARHFPNQIGESVDSHSISLGIGFDQVCQLVLDLSSSSSSKNNLDNSSFEPKAYPTSPIRTWTKIPITSGLIDSPSTSYQNSTKITGSIIVDTMSASTSCLPTSTRGPKVDFSWVPTLPTPLWSSC